MKAGRWVRVTLALGASLAIASLALGPRCARSSAPASVASPAAAGGPPEARASIEGAVAPTRALPPAVTRVREIASEADLDRYYADLEGRARTRGSVDDELHRAIEAYKASRGVVGPARASLKLRGFADRLTRLHRQQQIAPTLARLDSLAQRISDERDVQARARLASDYAIASAALPPVERIEAGDRLASLQLVR